jgi:hypothetical protein
MKYIITSLLLVLSLNVTSVSAQILPDPGSLLSPTPIISLPSLIPEPTIEPTIQPTVQPTASPIVTLSPTTMPSTNPTSSPEVSAIPTTLPTTSPIASPAATSQSSSNPVATSSSSPAIGGTSPSTTPSPTTNPTAAPQVVAGISTIIKDLDKKTEPVIKNIQDVAYAAALETPLSYIMSSEPTMFYTNHRLSTASTRFLLLTGFILVFMGYLILNPHINEKIRSGLDNYRNLFRQVG